MSGWRDADGRTARERRTQGDVEARTRFLDAVRRRPLSLAKPALGLAFAALLIGALILRWW